MSRHPSNSSLRPERTRHARAGFTMIEILIVITIIAILATLVFRGIASTQRKARQAQETNDITQLGLALQAFKDRYGIYPPSRIRLRENTAYDLTPSSPATPDELFDQHSVQYLKRIWPSIALPTASGALNPVTILWCKDDPSKTTATVLASSGTAGTPGDVDGTTYELEGDECLVFFLGGIAEFDRDNISSRPVILHGFTKNARNPGGSPDSADPTTISRDGPFYAFPADRLFVRVGSTQVESTVASPVPASAPPDFGLTGTRPAYKLPSLRSFQSTEANPIPVAYFSAYEGLGYRAEDCAFPREMISDQTSGASGANADPDYLIQFQTTWPGISTENTNVLSGHPYCAGPNPYTITRAAPNTTPTTYESTDTDPADSAGAIVKAFEPQTYQLISPGADSKFGRGGKLPPPASFSSSDPAYDNVSNVGGGQLIGTFAESQRKKQ